MMRLVFLTVLLCLVVRTQAAPLTWVEIETKNTPSGRRGSGFAYDTTRDLVWMFGGDPTDNTDLLYSFDPTTLEWDEIDVNGSDEPETRFSMVAGWSEELDSLVIGTGEGASKSLFYADMWAYQPQSNKWTRRSDGEAMPETRYGATGGIHTVGNNDEFVFTHGFRTDRYNDMWSRDVQKGDFVETIPREGDVPFERCIHAGTVVDDLMPLYGGCGSKGYGPCPSEEAWVFDFAEDEWSQVPQCLGPRMFVTMSRFEADTRSNGASRMVVTYGGVGGVFGAGDAGEVGVLDVDGLQWTRFVPQAAAGSSKPPAGQKMPGMVHVPANHPDVKSHPELDGISFVLVTTSEGGNLKTYALYGDPADSSSGDVGCRTLFDIRAFHGAMMFMSWGLLVPCGVFVAHYMRIKLKANAWWFKIHKICMLSGLFFGVAGLIAAVLMVPVHPMSIPHHILGALIMLFGLLQPSTPCVGRTWTQATQSPRSACAGSTSTKVSAAHWASSVS
jgi:hypothetical protein